METRRKRLEDLFQVGLVLLGVLSAAEFQYFLTVEIELSLDMPLQHLQRPLSSG